MSVYAVPQIPKPPDTDDIAALREYIQQLANVTAMAMKELDWLLNGNMDVKNIRANSIVAKLIKAGEITADKMNVTELSAISANLGTITAGIINAVTINSATINIKDNVTIGNNLTVGFGSNNRQIALGGAIFSFITSVLEINNPQAEINISALGAVNLSSLTSTYTAGGAAIKVAGSSTNSYNQGNHNHGIPNGTVLMVNGGGTVTFSESGGFTHSHTL